MALIFLFTTLSPAWGARDGNTADLETWKAWLMGTTVGILTAGAALISGAQGGYGASVAAGSIASDLVGLYMYYNNYSTYGETVASFHIFGTKVEISRGQFYSMVAGIIAGVAAGYATGAIVGEEVGEGAAEGAGKGAAGAGEGAGKGAAGGAAGGFWSGVGNAVSQVAQAIVDAVKNIYKIIENLIKKILDFIKSLLSNPVKALQEAFKALKEGIKNVGKSLVEHFKRLSVSKYVVYGARGEYGKALLSLAQDLVTGSIRLVATRTIEDVLIKKYGWDETLTKSVVSPALGIFVAAFADAFLSNLICQFTGWGVTSKGVFVEGEQKAKIEAAQQSQLGKIARARVEENPSSTGPHDAYNLVFENGTRLPISKEAVQGISSNLKIINYYGSIWNLVNNNNPLSAGFAAAASLGLGPLTYAAIQAAVLALLDYKTYYGSDDQGRKKENADKMILAHLAAGLAQRVVDGSGAGNNLSSDSRMTPEEMEKAKAQERVNLSNFLTDSFLAAGLDILYTHFIIENKLENATPLTGLGFLIAANLLLGPPPSSKDEKKGSTTSSPQELAPATSSREIVATSVGQAIAQSMFSSLPLPYYQKGDTRLDTRGQPVGGKYQDIVAQWRMTGYFQKRIDTMMRGGNPGEVTASTFGQNLGYFGSHVWSQQAQVEQQLRPQQPLQLQAQVGGQPQPGGPGATITVKVSVATPEEIVNSTQYGKAASDILSQRRLRDDSYADAVREEVLKILRADPSIPVSGIEGVIRKAVTDLYGLGYQDVLTEAVTTRGAPQPLPPPVKLPTVSVAPPVPVDSSVPPDERLAIREKFERNRDDAIATRGKAANLFWEKERAEGNPETNASEVISRTFPSLPVPPENPVNSSLREEPISSAENSKGITETNLPEEKKITIARLQEEVGVTQKRMESAEKRLKRLDEIYNSSTAGDFETYKELKMEAEQDYNKAEQAYRKTYEEWRNILIGTALLQSSLAK